MDFASRSVPRSIIFSTCFNVKIRGVIFSSSSGWAAPSASPSAAKIHIHSFTKPGSGNDAHNLRRRFAVYPVSSSEFPPRCGGRAFVRLLAPRHEFPQKFSDRVPVLADEEDAPILENGQHDDGSRMHDDVAVGAHSSRFDHRVALQTEYFTLIENFALEEFCAFGCQIRLRLHCFKYVAPVPRAGRASASNSNREAYAS